MAGIIAQITRANRKRMDNRKNHVSIAKCMYHINPFDECFEPVASNSPTLKLILLALKKNSLSCMRMAFYSYSKLSNCCDSTVGSIE